MSVILGDMFEDICRCAWGRNWKPEAAKYFGISERQLFNVASGRSNVSPDLREKLLTLSSEQRLIWQRYERFISGRPEIETGQTQHLHLTRNR